MFSNVTLMPDSPHQPTSFPLERYATHQAEISLLMSHFFLRYIKDLHRLFDGDLALAIVLAEIAHHSAGPLRAARKPGESIPTDDASLARMPSCSAYSLAAATGLPRETIRRKIARLTELGWVEKVDRAEVRITPKVGEHFIPDFNINLLDQLLQTADRIRGLMAS